ncbi:MAG: IclR family transcriptional regulator [Actinobacteria bacterium]|nr:IclR family transcriptional regulator [Actinomycetota bacterium]
MRSTVSGVGVLDKSVAILRAVEAQPLALNELVEATRMSRATAHRLAVALEHHGLVRRDDDGRFCLGVRLVALGQAAARAIPLAEAAAPALEALRGETGESVQLYVREGETRVCIAALESPHGLRTIVPLGAALPLDKGSAGKLLVPGASSPKKGWVESAGEREVGVASVSAPVHDTSGAVVAAVSVSGPIERTTRQPGRKYAVAVVRAARRIERASADLRIVESTHA